jgi:hypothetical protein
MEGEADDILGSSFLSPHNVYQSLHSKSTVGSSSLFTSEGKEMLDNHQME